MNETQSTQFMEAETLAIATREPQAVSLFRTDDPDEVVIRATKVASALRDVIAKQGLISNIKGKQYPKCEAWTLCGTMLGVFPVLSWTRQLADGWEARVEAKTRDGAIVGAAEAECLRSEGNWKNRDDFALRSMAQTRATAKALRMPLGFIMTLAGFCPTPAEEMQGITPIDDGADTDLAPVRPLSPRLPVADTPTVKPADKCATTHQRDKMLSELIAHFGDQKMLHEFACKAGILLETETLTDWPLRYVPATTKQYELLQAAVIDFCDGLQAVKPFTNAEPPAEVAKPVENATQSRQDEPWRAFVVPYGKHKGKPLGELERKTLFGFWAGHKLTNTFTGSDGTEVRKSATSLAKDKAFRDALDAAGTHYQFQAKEAA